MIREKALRKILITSITMLILLTIYVIKDFSKNNTIEANLELEYVTGIGTNSIYLLNENGFLVKSKILLTENNKEDQIKILLKNLIIDSSNKFPDGLSATIPKGTKILDINYDEGYVTLNFSKQFLNIKEDKEDNMFESIVYSIFDLKDIKGIFIQVEGEMLENYPHKKTKLNYPLTKEIGINKEYNLSKRDNINKVVIYYLEKIDNSNYYVPVTKYMNSDSDKIKIIIDSLTTSYIYEPNLMSFLNNNVKLNSYEENENVFFLDFNSSLYDKNNKVLEEVIYSISYSVFDNYDVKSVVFSVDGENIKTVSVNDDKANNLQ